MPGPREYLRIKLASEDGAAAKPAICPGTVLYGEVELKPRTEEKLVALTVVLLGKLVVKAEGKREVTQLFSMQHPIVRQDDDPISVPVKVNHFPFHFIVPWTTELDRSGTFKDDPEGIFTEKQHRTPPALGPKSFFFGGGDAQVKYSCYAVARRKGIRMNDFSPMQSFPRGEELEDIRCWAELSDITQGERVNAWKELTPPQPKQSAGLFRRASTVSMEGSPSLGKYRLTVECQDTAVLGEPIQLSIRIDRFDDDEAAAVARTASQNDNRWIVAVKTVDLVSKTFRRIKDVQRVWVDEDAATLSVVQKPLPLQEGVESKMELAINDVETVTSFRSYTISRMHRIRVIVLSSVTPDEKGKKTISQELVSLDVPIQVVRRAITSTVRRVSNDMGVETGEVASLPPAYEDSPVYRE